MVGLAASELKTDNSTEATRPTLPVVLGGRWAAHQESAFYALLFLLPVGAASVRHWVSTIFALLLLLSLPAAFRRPHHLLPAERRLFLVVVLFFAVFVLSAIVHEQARDWNREIRFLLLIPIYLALRRLPAADLWVLRGSAVAGYVLFVDAVYQVYFLGYERAWGAYHPSFMGPFTALTGVLALALYRAEHNRWIRVLAALSALGSLAALTLSASRGGFLGLLAMLAVWGGLRSRRRSYVATVGAIVMLSLLAYTASDPMRRAIDRGIDEIILVLEAENTKNIEGTLGSVPTRLAVWHASLLIVRDNLWVGIGRGNFANAVQRYVQEGRVHPDAALQNDPHNAYLEALVSKGVAGLAVLLALIVYPLSVFARTRRVSPDTALPGILLITGFAVFSLTDVWTFVKGYFISIFVVYLSVFYACHVRAPMRAES